MTRGSLLLALALVLGSLVLLSPPATAASGLTGQLSGQCVYAIQGGPVVYDNLNLTAPSPTNVSLAVVGSVPQYSKITLSPTSGETPLSVRVAIQANSSSGTGGYQVGVVATTAGGPLPMLFTLRVVSSAASESTPCTTIGLPLPESTVVVTLTSLGLGLLTQTVTRLFVDLDKERKMKAELNAFNKEKREASLAKDKAKSEKLKKKELAMRQAQSKVQLARTKVTFITIVPLFLVYYLMASFLGGYGSIVAFSPIPIPYLVGASGEMVLIWWYILGSFTLSSLLSRLMHTTT
jgi:uncharacterized membrane protein (DUF106 family)